MKFEYSSMIEIRLDQYLVSQIKEISREKIKNHIKEKLVLVNNEIIDKPKHKL